MYYIESRIIASDLLRPRCPRTMVGKCDHSTLTAYKASACDHIELKSHYNVSKPTLISEINNPQAPDDLGF